MTVALQVTNLVKTYGGARALNGVNLTVNQGEVHALLGQNGCGKSTLVKSLTGVVTPDSGTVSVYGKHLDLPVHAAHEHGIAVIHQDIGLVENMTVLENLGISARYGTRLFSPVRVKSEKSIYRGIMDRFGVHFDLNSMVADLSPAERALLGVVRALRLMEGHTDNQLFILDEPTAALSRPEAKSVLALMRRVADLGSAVVFISHRLAEVTEVCDRATVMRSGKDVIDTSLASVSRGDLVAEMLGRRMEEFFPHPAPFPPASALLEVRGVSGERVRDLSFGVAPGEVLGITGLAGMGQEELPGLLVGSQPLTAGEVYLDGEKQSFATPRESVAAGMALVPGNRLIDGIWLAGSAAENVTLPVVSKLTRRFRVQSKQLNALASTLMTGVNVHPNRPELPMAAFSGGNQQKIVFAKWMQLHPRVMLLDEPTQGVDPGSANELLKDAMALAAAGTAIVVFSGDHEQLAEICHRVIVLNDGERVAELSGDDLTERGLLEACEATPETLAAPAAA